MTKLLEQAIAQARHLSEAEQDALAETLLAHLAGDDTTRYRLTDEQMAEVRRRLADPEPRFLTLDEVGARFPCETA